MRSRGACAQELQFPQRGQQQQPSVHRSVRAQLASAPRSGEAGPPDARTQGWSGVQKQRLVHRPTDPKALVPAETSASRHHSPSMRSRGACAQELQFPQRGQQQQPSVHRSVRAQLASAPRSGEAGPPDARTQGWSGVQKQRLVHRPTDPKALVPAETSASRHHSPSIRSRGACAQELQFPQRGNLLQGAVLQSVVG